VERWSEQYRVLLTAAMEQPEERVSRLPLIGEAERQRLLVEWNQTAAEYPRESTFHELFEAQAEQTPQRAAVCCEGLTLSYSELNQQANRLAHYLRELGVGPDGRVGLCVERSVETLVGVLAILKAGGAYVALNAQHPAARLKQQMEGVVVLLTERKWREQMSGCGVQAVYLDADCEHWQNRPSGNLERLAQSSNYMYVIYTSGSTGTPKGVQVRHRNLVNYSYAVMRKLGWDQEPEGLQFATVTTLSADLGNTCIYPALLTGGCVHLIRPERASDSQALGE
jgi:non-ribosomal peptide synthetase component F